MACFCFSFASCQFRNLCGFIRSSDEICLRCCFFVQLISNRRKKTRFIKQAAWDQTKKPNEWLIKKLIFSAYKEKRKSDFFFWKYYSGSAHSTLITSPSFEAIYIRRNISYLKPLKWNNECEIRRWFPIEIIEMWKQNTLFTSDLSQLTSPHTWNRVFSLSPACSVSKNGIHYSVDSSVNSKAEKKNSNAFALLTDWFALINNTRWMATQIQKPRILFDDEYSRLVFVSRCSKWVLPRANQRLRTAYQMKSDGNSVKLKHGKNHE